MDNQPSNEADLVLNIRDQPNDVIIRTYDNFRDEYTGYFLKRKSGFDLDDEEDGRLEFTSDCISTIRPVYKKACQEMVGDEERRNPTPATTDEKDDDDDQCPREPAAEVPTANNNTNNSITEFQRDTETGVIVSGNNNGNTEHGAIVTGNNNGNTENGVIAAHDNHVIEQIDLNSESNDSTLRCNQAVNDYHKEKQ